jgi:toxin-antitoxin system PIN domain toxin
VRRAYLLDVNVLVALFDPDHVHHDLAHDWFADVGRPAWATCPVTENGFVRVLCNPGYGASVARASELIERLRVFRESGGHSFWPDEISLTDASLFDPAMLAGHRQVTDIYLLGLASRNRGYLATFDRTIPVKAVRRAGHDTLQLIEPAGVL